MIHRSAYNKAGCPTKDIPRIRESFSLRWHYPNQVPGRNIISFLSAGSLPAPLFFQGNGRPTISVAPVVSSSVLYAPHLFFSITVFHFRAFRHTGSCLIIRFFRERTFVKNQLFGTGPFATIRLFGTGPFATIRLFRDGAFCDYTAFPGRDLLRYPVFSGQADPQRA